MTIITIVTNKQTMCLGQGFLTRGARSVPRGCMIIGLYKYEAIIYVASIMTILTFNPSIYFFVNVKLIYILVLYFSSSTRWRSRQTNACDVCGLVAT